MTKRSPFRYFKASPEIIRLAVMLYVRFPLSLQNVEDLPHERGGDVSHEAVRYWWHLDEMFVKISGERDILWRAVVLEGHEAERASWISVAFAAGGFSS